MKKLAQLFLLLTMAASGYAQNNLANQYWPLGTATSATTLSTVQLKGANGQFWSFAAGNITVTGVSLTTATFSVYGSSQTGCAAGTFVALPINVLGTPGTTNTSMTVTSSPTVYQVPLLGVQCVYVQTTGTFTATSVAFNMNGSPTGVISRNTGGTTGTVTSFSYQANVSPLSTLFTCNVTNPTTTPNLTCTAASSVAQNAVLAGPASGGSGAWSFRGLVAADLPAATTSAQGAVVMPTGSSGNTLGTAAVQNIGTSGATVPLLSAPNTFSAQNIFSNYVGLSGTTGLWNGSNLNNGNFYFASTGPLITRNIADANPALAVNNANASSTGKIVSLQASGTEVASVDRSGHVITSKLNTSTVCSQTASPAACGSSSAGVVQLAASATSLVIDSTAITSSTGCWFTYDTSGITAPTNIASLFSPYISARSAGTSITITAPVAPLTNPVNIQFFCAN